MYAKCFELDIFSKKVSEVVLCINWRQSVRHQISTGANGLLVLNTHNVKTQYELNTIWSIFVFINYCTMFSNNVNETNRAF